MHIVLTFNAYAHERCRTCTVCFLWPSLVGSYRRTFARVRVTCTYMKITSSLSVYCPVCTGNIDAVYPSSQYYSVLKTATSGFIQVFISAHPSQRDEMWTLKIAKIIKPALKRDIVVDVIIVSRFDQERYVINVIDVLFVWTHVTDRLLKNGKRVGYPFLAERLSFHAVACRSSNPDVSWIPHVVTDSSRDLRTFRWQPICRPIWS